MRHDLHVLLRKTVHSDLLAGGCESQDCELHTAEGVAEAATRNLRNSSGGFLAMLGKSDDAVRLHLELAKQGAAFLLIYAPGDLEASRAMNVIRRVPFAFAHRYHRLVIEELA